ncbi:phospholipase effector Tle1 domain-containing protein [Pseudoxanthomonas dokdonensis]|uniref:T6SS Phospholipase effector Tle1-like catalytic domain-containing protein n=1 Tax=Pseudoxanthomonas dokdonensis TaxID=344882 RepID=A0A0R0CQE4_9GAMM|nr:DUF2235 domain-containing protein [Pseudoxanthomonas dokdonensis]KRG71691.1 hypothetical protein ABB29_02850 [Pseudoxanthomonas dokdonensis]
MSEKIDPARPDGVDTYPVDSAMLSTYDRARAELKRFQVPVLAGGPHQRLFVANFDGTGNDMYQEPLRITNVGVFGKQIEQASRERGANVAGHYVTGVGTQDNGIVRRIDEAVGYSYGPRMEQMYFDFITQAKEWQREDPNAEISLASVGFSRGAVTASLFTRLVHERGIQNPDGMILERGADGQLIGMTPTKRPLVPPGQTRQVLGMFDPVATGDLNLADVRPAPSVVSGLQITALHDARDVFLIKYIFDRGVSADGRFLNVMVPGAHSDTGGSYLLNGLSVRSGNLMAGWLNTVAGQPLLQDQPVPSDPRMNVVHRSEQHLAIYTTLGFDAAGRRLGTEDLAGNRVLPRQEANNPLPADPALMRGLDYRPVQLPAERFDDSVPAFLLPEPGPAAPTDVQWNQLWQNTPLGMQPGNGPQAPGKRPGQGVDADYTPAHDPRVAAVLNAADRGDRDTIIAIGREYAQTPAGQAWLQQGRDELDRQLAQRAREQQALEERALEQQAREQEQEQQRMLALQAEEPQRRQGRSI